ncbi:MAG: class I SAM-dependent methyltransferase [Thermoanaerobaculia bacterium]
MVQPTKWFLEPGFASRSIRVFGWTTLPELQYLRACFARQLTGQGAAVELGCALGRSTIAMLEGLAENPACAGAPLQVYDWMKFDWLLLEEYRRFAGAAAAGIVEGDDFEPIFRRNVEPWSDRVRLHVGDIARASWDGGPIEILFVDIMKSWPATLGVLRTFYPHLVPGLSLVIHQDFKNPFLPHILLTAYRLREHFEPVVTVCGDGSSTVAFRCVRRIAPETLERLESAGICDLGSYSVAEIEAAVDYALSVVHEDPEPERHAILAAAETIWLDLLVRRVDAVHAVRRIPAWQVQLRERVSRLRPEAGDSAQDPWSSLEAARDREREALSALGEAREVLQRIHDSRAFKLASLGWRLRRALGRSRPTPER